MAPVRPDISLRCLSFEGGRGSVHRKGYLTAVQLLSPLPTRCDIVPGIVCKGSQIEQDSRKSPPLLSINLLCYISPEPSCWELHLKVYPGRQKLRRSIWELRGNHQSNTYDEEWGCSIKHSSSEFRERMSHHTWFSRPWNQSHCCSVEHGYYVK